MEDLAAPDGTLHPVQQAMVDCHGSQCGFCTPGFVMSLWAGYQRHQAAGTVPTRQQLADDLSGNLCRCTGYRPILDAGQRTFELPAPALDRAAVAAALRGLQQDPPLHYAPGGGAPAFHAPRTLDEFAALREALPQARVLAGSTDMGLWVTKQFRDLGELIYVGEVAELKRIERAAATASSSAPRASLEDAWQALVARVAHAARRLAALRLAADARGRHDGRQRRQRLAHRRLGAGADGAGRDHRAAPRRARAHDAAATTSTSTT